MPTVHIQLSETDFVHAARAASVPTRRWFQLLIIIVVLVSVGLIFVWRIGYMRESIIGLCILLGALIGGWVGRNISIGTGARRIFQQQKTLHRPYQVTWNSDGITVNSENGASTVPWADFHKRRELPGQFLLFLSDANFLMVPKRVFPDPSLRNQFRDIVTQRVRGQ